MRRLPYSGRILSLLLLFISTSAFAEFLDLPAEFRDPCLRSTGRTAFIKPNETMPHRAKPILEKAPAGAYISVGTERGIFGAIQAPQITHLILADYSAHICFFNKMNIALIRLSHGDRKLYRFFRQESLHQDWKDAVSKATDLSPSDAMMLNSFEHYDKWTKAARRPLHPEAVDFEIGENQFGQHFAGDVHYVFNDKAFEKIYRLIADNKVDVILLNLADPYGVPTLGKAMSRANVPLSVIDISNAWWSNFMGSENVLRLSALVVEHFIVGPASYMLATSDNFILPSGVRILDEKRIGSTFSRYTAFTFDFMNKHRAVFSDSAYDGSIDQLKSLNVEELPTIRASYADRIANLWRGCTQALSKDEER